jgi:hypothetical protein
MPLVGAGGWGLEARVKGANARRLGWVGCRPPPDTLLHNPASARALLRPAAAGAATPVAGPRRLVRAPPSVRVPAAGGHPDGCGDGPARRRAQPRQRARAAPLQHNLVRGGAGGGGGWPWGSSAPSAPALVPTNPPKNPPPSPTQMADSTLQRIFGTILGAFCSRHLGAALQGIADKVGAHTRAQLRPGAQQAPPPLLLPAQPPAAPSPSPPGRSPLARSWCLPPSPSSTPSARSCCRRRPRATTPTTCATCPRQGGGAGLGG